ncbi:MAG: SpoVA/SpoVAEb family sporulation membrane protein [Clostridia bacterium]|nr:SpoVA/SpoVAEb family sporulation membrane protein [Clostridia bacterium]
MKMTEKEFRQRVKRASPPSPKLKNLIWAYAVGGGICAVGQLLKVGYTALGLSADTVKMAVPCTLIFAAALLTGLRLFERLAKHAGAGTLVPITGFANAVVSPAIEYKSEGYVPGIGTKMFAIAGPVILYGTVASVIYGVIYWLIEYV